MNVQPTMLKAAARYAVDSGLNMILRGLTLASKFFLLVYLAKVIPPEQLGVYGLFTVTISYALYLLGLDFYAYAHREMLSLPHTACGGIIRNQFVFYAVVYLIVLPILLLVFVTGWLPWQMVGWFYLILTMEHLSQELYRLLAVLGRVTRANLVLFLRAGAWVFVVLALFWAEPRLRGLAPIWGAWCGGVALSILVAWSGVRPLIGSMAHVPVDWPWMRRGLKVAAHFLVGTLALRGLFTFDRYFLDLYAGKSAVGVYSLFMGLANALQAFADAGAVSRLYPRIVAAYRRGSLEEYRRELRKLAASILLLNLGFSLVLFVALEPILRYIGREPYLEQAGTLWILVLAIALYCLGLVPHYALYARGCDRALVGASLLALAVFWGAALWLTPAGGTAGMALAVLAGVASLGVAKLYLVGRQPSMATERDH